MNILGVSEGDRRPGRKTEPHIVVGRRGTISPTWWGLLSREFRRPCRAKSHTSSFSVRGNPIQSPRLSTSKRSSSRTPTVPRLEGRQQTTRDPGKVLRFSPPCSTLEWYKTVSTYLPSTPDPRHRRRTVTVRYEETTSHSRNFRVSRPDLRTSRCGQHTRTPVLTRV